MRAWRICKASRAADLSGKGAELEGGRWNEEKNAAVYMGLTPTICVLETFVHLNGRPLVPLKIVEWELPDDVDLYLEPAMDNLPAGWNSLPADTPSMAYGTSWLKSRSHLGLIVPSAVLELDRNIVLNPLHPAISQVRSVGEWDFNYDERMFNLRD